MKPARQSVIMEIITENEIETQNQLMETLLARGIKSTQATLSRDIKDMRLVKELGANGKYHYTAGGATESTGYQERLKKIFKECVTSYTTAQNIIVIKTLPGLADAACSTLDSMTYMFDYLIQMGYSPKLFYEKTDYSFVQRLEDSYPYYLDAICTHKDLCADEKKQIKDYIASVAVDGTVTERMNPTIVTIYWDNMNMP